MYSAMLSYCFIYSKRSGREDAAEHNYNAETLEFLSQGQYVKDDFFVRCEYICITLE